jgi:DNA-binding NarL/FixJ family response regulator
MRVSLIYSMTRVLISDDSELVRSGLHELIEDHAGWFCTEAVNGRCNHTNSTSSPDILILDLSCRNGRTQAVVNIKLVPNLAILLCA